MASSPRQSISSPLLRRRDKRRQQHSSSSSAAGGGQPSPWPELFSSSPQEIVALAVRYDETRKTALDLLAQPLETGRLYDPQQFLTALQMLRDEIQPGGGRQKRRKEDEPSFALTPIILSGLLTAMQEQREEAEASSSGTAVVPEDMSSQLMAACQAMRRQALTRVKLRKKRRQVQKIVIPAVTVAILFFLYLRTMSDLRRILIDLHFVGSCEEWPAYGPACRLAEAALWWKFRDYARYLSVPCSRDGTDCKHAALDARYLESPFSMHSTLSQETITWEELKSGTPVGKKPPTRPAKEGWRWLGRSTVNDLVREALDHYSTAGKERKVLDVGCGVGGTFYALLADDDERERQKFSYRGISASAAEIHLAKELLRYHGLDNGTTTAAVAFEQKNFDEPLGSAEYTAVVAIESLAYSRNLANTLKNLVRALKKGGLLVVLDDVAYPQLPVSEQDSRLRPSLLPHTTWKTELEAAGCRLRLNRDLSLEYEMSYFPITRKHHLEVWQWGSPFEHWMAATGNAASQRLVELQQEREVLAEMWQIRRDSYVMTATLSYFMYVCVKT